MLGVLGGMGPMATVDFMRKVVEHTPARRDQDHIEMLVCSAPGIPDRTEAILGTGPDPLNAIRGALRRLERAGATCIAIPCNTAHHWHAALQEDTEVPVLHIVDAVVDMLEQRGINDGDIGVLATTGTLAVDVYQSRLARGGYNVVAPDAKGQAEVMRAIGLVKTGRADEAQVILLREAKSLRAAGCRQVIMACTEIPIALVLPPADLRPFLLDATEALARACIAFCLSSKKAAGVPDFLAPRSARLVRFGSSQIGSGQILAL